MLIKGTLVGSCALLGSLLFSQPVRSAEPVEVKPLVYTTSANATTVEDRSGTTAVQEVRWRHGGHGWGGGGRGWGGGHGWGGGGHGWGGGWGGRSSFSVGFGYGGYGGYYGRGYYPGYYSYYARPYYGYGNYYPRYYGYNYASYAPSYVSVGIGGPGYSEYYGGYPYYGSYGCY